MFRKGLVVAAILLFIGMCVVPSTAVKEFNDVLSVGFDGNTLYVGGSGPNNYTTIQSAIDDAVYGDTVFVYSGRYTENIKIKKDNINLLGEDRETTIIDGSDTTSSTIRIHNGAHVSIQNVTVSGFKVKNYNPKCDETEVIYVWGDYCEISNNIIVGPKNIGEENIGVAFYCLHGIVSNNIISDCDIGIYCNGGYNTISGNTLKRHTYFGIFLKEAMYNRIINNNIYETELSNEPFDDDHPNLYFSNAGFEQLKCILNVWTRNYWGEPKFFLMPILGYIMITNIWGFAYPSPLLTFEIFPRKIPYIGI